MPVFRQGYPGVGEASGGNQKTLRLNAPAQHRHVFVTLIPYAGFISHRRQGLIRRDHYLKILGAFFPEIIPFHNRHIKHDVIRRKYHGALACLKSFQGEILRVVEVQDIRGLPVLDQRVEADAAPRPRRFLNELKRRHVALVQEEFFAYGLVPQSRRELGVLFINDLALCYVPVDPHGTAFSPVLIDVINKTPVAAEVDEKERKRYEEHQEENRQKYDDCEFFHSTLSPTIECANSDFSFGWRLAKLDLAEICFMMSRGQFLIMCRNDTVSPGKRT